MQNEVQALIDNVKAQPLQPFLKEADYQHLFQQGNSSLFGGMANYMHRQQFVQDYGYVLVTEETLAALVSLLAGKKVMDAGCGSGYLALALAERGVDITAVDTVDYPKSGDRGYAFQKRYKLDHQGNAVDLLPGNFDAVLLSWPCYSTSFGYDVAAAMKPGQMLVYQGESRGGCTGNDDFHDFLYNKARWIEDERRSDVLNEHHLQFDGIHDWWTVYHRR